MWKTGMMIMQAERTQSQNRWSAGRRRLEEGQQARKCGRQKKMEDRTPRGDARQPLLLVLQGGLLQLFRRISSAVLLLSQLSLGGRKGVGLGGLLRSIGAAAVGLGGRGLFFLETGDLLLGLLNVL